MPVLVDGGIRRGTDVLKAMALGASAVLVGRPVLHGLANAGAAGVAHVLRLLRDELEIAMALCGCRTLDEAPALGLVDSAAPPPDLREPMAHRTERHNANTLNRIDSHLQYHAQPTRNTQQEPTPCTKL